MNPEILGLVCEYGISNDGKPLVNEQGLLRFQAIDWEKTNPIIIEKMGDVLYKLPPEFQNHIQTGLFS